MALPIRNLERALGRLAALPDAVVRDVAPVLQSNAETLSGMIARACAEPEIAKNVRFSQRKAAQLGGDAGGTAQLRNALAQRGMVWDVLVTTSMKVVPGRRYPKVFNPRWEEFGTAPHLIPPRTAVGVTKMQGWQHPGARRRPFFWPTVRAWKKTFKSKVTRAMNKAVKRAAAK